MDIRTNHHYPIRWLRLQRVNIIMATIMARVRYCLCTFKDPDQFICP